jgi:hypothetical protein
MEVSVLNTKYTQLKISRTSNRVWSAMTLWNPIPTPSITARKIAHMMAPFLAAFTPPRIAKEPPVKKPAMTGDDDQFAFSTAVAADPA